MQRANYVVIFVVCSRIRVLEKIKMYCIIQFQKNSLDLFKYYFTVKSNEIDAVSTTIAQDAILTFTHETCTFNPQMYVLRGRIYYLFVITTSIKLKKKNY